MSMSKLKIKFENNISLGDINFNLSICLFLKSSATLNITLDSLTYFKLMNCSYFPKYMFTKKYINAL